MSFDEIFDLTAGVYFHFLYYIYMYIGTIFIAFDGDSLRHQVGTIFVA